MIYSLAYQPELRYYVHGKLALAGMDLRTPLTTWLDSVYAIVADAPHEFLEKLWPKIAQLAARVKPDRETWGVLPEHQALTAKLTQGGARGEDHQPSQRPGGRGG